jgi:hypothetical protein
MSWRKVNRKFNSYIDSTSPYKGRRWGIATALLLYLIYRIAIYEHIAVIYLFGLYINYLLMQFYTSIGLPNPDEDDLNIIVGITIQNVDIPYTM